MARFTEEQLRDFSEKALVLSTEEPAEFLIDFERYDALIQEVKRQGREVNPDWLDTRGAMDAFVDYLDALGIENYTFERIPQDEMRNVPWYRLRFDNSAEAAMILGSNQDLGITLMHAEWKENELEAQYEPEEYRELRIGANQLYLTFGASDRLRYADCGAVAERGPDLMSFDMYYRMPMALREFVRDVKRELFAELEILGHGEYDRLRGTFELFDPPAEDTIPVFAFHATEPHVMQSTDELDWVFGQFAATATGSNSTRNMIDLVVGYFPDLATAILPVMEIMNNEQLRAEYAVMMENLQGRTG